MSNYSLHFDNLPVRSYKFNYDHLFYGSKKFRNKIFDYLELSGDEKIIKSKYMFERYIKDGR